MENQNKRTINFFFLEEVQSRLEKLNRKAKRLGLSEITLNVGKPYEVEVPIRDELGIVTDIEIQIKCEVEVIGAMPKIAGYSFIAKIEHTRNNETGERLKNMVKGMVDNLPLEYHDLDSNCAHCNSKRFRKETYIIERTEDGARLQVGSECLKNYMTKKSVEGVLFASNIGSLFDNESGFSRAKPYVKTVQFVAAAINFARERGFATKASSQGGSCLATAALAWEQYHPVRDNQGHIVSLRTHVSELDIENAAAYIETVKQMSADTSFKMNLSIALQQPFIFLKDAGIVAVVAKMYLSDEAKKSEAKKNQVRTNEFFGEVGQKIEAVVDVKFKTILEGQYGESALLVMVEEKTGHTFKTVTTGAAFNLVVGDRAVIAGTVKKHEEYKERKQTVLTRIKVLEVQSQEQEQVETTLPS